MTQSHKQWDIENELSQFIWKNELRKWSQSICRVKYEVAKSAVKQARKEGGRRDVAACVCAQGKLKQRR
jgi:hypothetical protein